MFLDRKLLFKLPLILVRFKLFTNLYRAALFGSVNSFGRFGDATNWKTGRLIVIVLWVDVGAAEGQVPSVGA